jgi:hypothetical protein
MRPVMQHNESARKRGHPKAWLLAELILSVIMAVAGAFVWGKALAYYPALDDWFGVHFAPDTQCVLSSIESSCVSSNPHVDATVRIRIPASRPPPKACTYGVRVDWGNGSAVSAGPPVQGADPGIVEVGTHTYVTRKTYNVTVTLIRNPRACPNRLGPFHYTFRLSQ